MTRTVSVKRFDGIDAYAEHPGGVLPGQHVFMLPRWMKEWRQVFKPDDELSVYVICVNERSIGVAPLSIRGTTASFVGDPEVFDYMDFAVTPGYEREFYDALLDDLSGRGVSELSLRCLRPESTVFSRLSKLVRARHGECVFEPDGISVEMDLPGDWDTYLDTLHGRQRHEVRRKLRRLEAEAEWELLVLDDAAEISERLDAFLKMFRESRRDKAAFMTLQMESFFRVMMSAMAEEGLLRLFVLHLNDAPAAAALCFDYEGTVYLYNSGYDPAYSSLSVGLLCKILSIKHSIGLGRKRYDFLKGSEPYKYQLGGRDVRLTRCRIEIKPG